MKIFILGLGFVFVSVFCVGLGLVVYGKSLPETHQAQVSVELKATPAQIWALITDYKNMPEWLSEVRKVEEEKTAEGKKVTWMTDSHNQRLPFITEEEIREKRLVRKVTGDQTFFGGKWIFELEPRSAGTTRFTLREEGFIKPPLFRAMMKFTGGPEKSLRGFADSLTQRLSRP